MNNIFSSFNSKVKDFSKMQKRIQDDFLVATVKRNSIMIIIAALFAILIEEYNIATIFLYSDVNLNSLNNRIYFYFYLSLIVMSIMALIFIPRFKNNIKVLYKLDVAFMYFYILWSLLINSYALAKGHDESSLVFATALIFATILLRIKLSHTIIIQVSSIIIFLSINGSNASENFNTAIAVFSAIVLNCVVHAQYVVSLNNDIEVKKMNRVLKNDEEILRINLEKYKIITTQANIYSFEWNLSKDLLIPSVNLQKTFDIPEVINSPEKWLEEEDFVFEQDKKINFNLISNCIKKHENANIDLRIKNKKNEYLWFNLAIFIQYNNDDKAVSLIGILHNIDGTKRLVQNLYTQLQIQTEGSKQYLNHLKTSQNKTEIYKHDIKHSLKLLNQLALQGDLDGIQSYVSRSNEEILQIESNFYCENDTVNLILGSFHQLSQSNGIKFNTDIDLPKNLPIQDTEICALYYNILENALTATKNTLLEKDKFIYVKSLLKDDKLLINVENGFNGEIIMKDDLPVSIKKDGGHGFGIKSIIDITERYDGLYTFEPKGNIFTTKILLYFS